MLTFIDLFAGAGGFRLGMEQAGHKCVGYCEIDKYARKAYEAYFNIKGEWTAHDVRTVKPLSMPDFDVLCGGFPCQDNSIISQMRLGLEGSRSGLFYEICRIAGVKKPKYILLENVEGLLSVGKRLHFANVLTSLEELGYIPEWQVCNSRRLLPQNRPRVFIVGHLREARFKPVFPMPEIVYLHDRRENQEEEQPVTRCLLARRGGPSVDETYICEPGGGPRRITPRELFKLQGFPPDFVDIARKTGVPTSELRAMAGNAVSVPVVRKIAERLN